MSTAQSHAPATGGVLPAFRVPSAQQWLSMTEGRVAPDGYSWLQAVHWTVGSGVYAPQRAHGPRAMGRTTIRVAQELAKLCPCRPGIAYLVRQLGLSERTVEYHLEMLREAGLLAYIVRGTRARGRAATASEYALIIPPCYDAALGIRTRDDEVLRRRMTGICDAGRELMARLGRKAARKIRAPRRPKSTSTAPANTPAQPPAPHQNQQVDGASESNSRCTPMGVGTSSETKAQVGNQNPPEAKLARGDRNSSPTKKPRKLNTVGRRYQLAAELVRQVPWLRRANVARIAWVIREVSDAGWTATDVMSWLDANPEPAAGVRRPSALLAHRLRGMTTMPGWATPDQRALSVQEWRDSRMAEHARHDQRAGWSGAGEWTPPTSLAVRREVDGALAEPPAAHPDATADAAEVLAECTTGDAPEQLDDLTRAEVLSLRAAGRRNPAVVLAAIADLGEAWARRLYTNALVNEVQHAYRPITTRPTMILHTTGGHA